ncbi:MAG: hypothetical protein WCE80_03470 [Acidimicrobiia bacterium]
MRLARRRKPLIATLAAAMVLTLPGVALAHDTTDTTTDTAATEEVPTPEPTEVLSTLPVLGAGLNITIGRDDQGAISSIALDPDTATVLKEGDHRVIFLLADGNTQVVVKSGKGFVQTTVRGDATNVGGDGAWSADVFGNGLVTVPYNVSFDGTTPTMSVGAVTVPGGVTAEVGDPKTKTSDDADKAYTKVKVKLTFGDQTATLSLKAKTYVDDEGATKVKVSATLSSRDRVNCHDVGRDHDGGDRDSVGRDWKSDRGSGDRTRGDHEKWHGDRDSRRGDGRDGVGG